MYKALAVCMLLLCPMAHAQVDEAAIREKFNKIRNQRGYNKTHHFRSKAKEKLRREGRYFDHERVEVTGFLSGDNTAKEFPELFDGPRIKPSAMPKEKTDSGFLQRLLEGVKRNRRLAGATWNDTKNYFMDNSGRLSPAGQKAVAELKDKDINEIVAHSWGTEVIFNAIIDGYVKPPKKLIALGTPDSDSAKWRFLAEELGIEVVVINSKDDPIHNKIGSLSRKYLRSRDIKSLHVRWEEAKRERGAKPRPLPPGVKAEAKSFTITGSDIVHGRSDYYNHLKKDMLKESAQDLQNRSRTFLDNEAAKLKAKTLESAYEEARTVVVQEARLLKEKMAERTRRARAEEEARQRRVWKCAPSIALGELSRKACNTPGGVSPLDLAGATITWFGSSDIELDITCLDNGGKGLTGCPKEVFDMVHGYHKIWSRSIWPEGFLLEKINNKAPVGAIYGGSVDLRPGDLAILAKNACAAPGSIGQSDLKSINDWFPDPNIDQALVEFWKGNLTGCAKELYLKFLEFNRTWPKGDTINYKWINAKARELTTKSPSSSSPSSGGGGGGGDGNNHDIDLPTIKDIKGKL